MALDSYPALNPDGLTALEQNREAVRDTLRTHLSDTDDDTIWQITLAVTENLAFIQPPSPTSLTYAWTDGRTFSHVDQPGGIPDNRRERSVLRGLLTHTLQALDEHDNGLHLHTAPADFQ